MQTAFDNRAYMSSSMSLNVRQPTFNMPSAFFGAGPAMSGAMHSVAQPSPTHFGGASGSSKSTSTQFMQQFSGSANGSFSSMSAFQKTSASANRYQETSAFSSQWSNSNSFGSSQYLQQTSIRTNHQDLQNKCSSRYLPPTSNCTNDRNWQKNNGSVTPVSNGKSTINFGGLKVELDKNTSSFKFDNEDNKKSTEANGDPHLIGPDGKSTMFKGPVKFLTANKATVTLIPKSYGGSATYVNEAIINMGNAGYHITGLGEKDGAPLKVERISNAQELLAQTPPAFTVVAKPDGSGWIDPATHKAADFSKA